MTFTNSLVFPSKKFLKMRQFSELLLELGSFVFLLQFELVFTGVIPQSTEEFWSFFSQNVDFLISLNSSVSWNWIWWSSALLWRFDYQSELQYPACE